MEDTLPFNDIFRLPMRALVAKTQPDKVVRWCADGKFLAIFWGPAFFSEPRAARFRPAA